MKVRITPRAAKQLKKISHQDKKKLLKKIQWLSENPYSGKILKGELRQLRSLRVWPYRIIYQVGKMLTIYGVAHRKSVYKVN